MTKFTVVKQTVKTTRKQHKCTFMFRQVMPESLKEKLK